MQTIFLEKRLVISLYWFAAQQETSTITYQTVFLSTQNLIHNQLILVQDYQSNRKCGLKFGENKQLLKNVCYRLLSMLSAGLSASQDSAEKLKRGLFDYILVCWHIQFQNDFYSNHFCGKFRSINPLLARFLLKF